MALWVLIFKIGKMKTKIIGLLAILLVSTMALSQNSESDNNDVWQMEEQYWDYVQKNDTISYKNLWHENFMGYPSLGDGVSVKSKIATWIPKLHEDPNLTFS